MPWRQLHEPRRTLRARALLAARGKTLSARLYILALSVYGSFEMYGVLSAGSLIRLTAVPCARATQCIGKG